MAVGGQGAGGTIFGPVLVGEKVPWPGTNLHIHIKSKVSLHANWTSPGKALLMNAAIELHTAGLSSDRCAINSPFGREPEGEAKAELLAVG